MPDISDSFSTLKTVSWQQEGIFLKYSSQMQEMRDISYFFKITQAGSRATHLLLDFLFATDSQPQKNLWKKGKRFIFWQRTNQRATLRPSMR